MNGPEHYRKAESLVEHSKKHVDTGDPRDEAIAHLAAAQAQVHATLALVAAEAVPTLGLRGVPSTEWAEATR